MRAGDGRGGQVALDAAAAGWVTGLAIPSILPIFAGAGAPWMVLGAALPTVVAVVSVLLRALTLTRLWGQPWVRLGADVVGVVVVVATVPAGSGGQAALAGLPSGAAKLITSALPASGGGPELGVVVVAVAIAAGLAGELAVRTQANLLPLAPALVLYGATLAVGTGGLPTPGWGALVVVGGAAIAALLRRQRPLAGGAGRDPQGPVIAGGRRPPLNVSWPRLGAGLAAAVVVTAVALPVGINLPGAGSRPPYDLRAAVQPATQVPDQLNPLVTYAAIYDDPPRPVFSVQATGADPRSLYWRLNTLDHFAGTGWTSTGSLLRAGSTLPPGPRLAVPITKVVAAVSLAGPVLNRSAVYLPAPDRPTQVSIAGLDASPADSVLAVPFGKPPPSHYVVRASVPSPGKRYLLGVSALRRPDPGSPALPEPIPSVAAAIVASALPSPFARLAAIGAFLTGPGFVRHPAGGSPIGAGSYQVLQLLRDHDGSAAQYAAAFALLARAVGFDVRLAVGYTGGTSGGPGVVDFTTRDLSVWPEVHLDGVGWYPWPTVPGTGSASRDPAPAQASSPIGQAIAEQRGLNASAPPSRAGAPPPAAHRTRAPGPLVWAPLVASLAALVLLAGLVIGAAKVGRRQRQRRRIDPRQRVAGAWECVLDRLSELGVNVDPALTVPEVVDRAVTRVGASGVGPLPKLVRVIDSSRYDRQFPPTPTMADSAWAQTLEVERSLRAAVPTARRLRALVSPAPWRRR